MATDNTIKTKGIIISEQRYRESSKILNIFTEKRGRINTIASGVLRPKSGLMLATEKLVESEFILNLNKGRFYIKEGEVLNSNIELSENLKSLFVGEIISEILLFTMPENMIDEKVYGLVSETFRNLREGVISPRLLNLGFQLKFISLIGFKPILSKCGSCGSKNYQNMYFSYEDGGIICGNCLRNSKFYVKIDRGELELLIQLLFSKFSDYDKLNLEGINCEKVENIILNYLLYNTELTELKSQTKLNKLLGI